MSFFGKKYSISSLDNLYSLARNLRAEVNKYKLILIKVPHLLEKKQFIKFSFLASSKDKIQESFISWDFGILMELKEDPSSPNYLFSRERVPFHWDGAFHEVPNILVFNSLIDMEGGKTFFVDTEKIISDLEQEEIEELSNLEILYSTKKLAHYGGKISQKAIIKHPITGKNIIRIGEEVLTEKNPVKRRVVNNVSFDLVKKVEQMFYHNKYFYAHKWCKGDILLADNFSLLHGREDFISSSNKKRHLRRIQIR